MTYTIGVQVWRLPIFRKFKVVNHSVEDGKVALYDALGGCTVVPGLDRKALRIYPDYRRVWEHKKRQQERLEATAARIEREHDDLVSAHERLLQEFPVAPVPGFDPSDVYTNP